MAYRSFKTILRTAIMRLGDDVLTCYIDALDECDDNESRGIIDFFEYLTESTESDGIKLFLCISCRHYPRITMSKSLELELDYQAGHANDISRYVKSRLKVANSAQKRRLTNAVCERAAGVFLWVKLAVIELNKEDCDGNFNKLQDCLVRLPDKLPEFFALIVRKDLRVDPAFIPTIQWTLFSQRPLRREELYSAVQTSLGYNSDTIQTCETEGMGRFILRSSKGFVELVQGKQPTFQFIHETVREYFSSTGLTAFSPTLDENAEGRSHHRLMQCCQDYLQHGVLAKASLPKFLPQASWPESKRLREAMLVSYPFLNYALCGLIYHADRAHSLQVSQDEFLETFQVESWKKLRNILEKIQFRRYTKSPKRRWIFAEQGASFLLEMDLLKHPETSSESRHTLTVLGVAMERKHLRSVQVLLKCGAEADSSASSNLSCLGMAVKQNAVQIVRALLESGASADPETVQRALQKGYLEVVQALLGATSSSQTYGECLPTAASSRHLHIVQWLLEKGAGVDTTSERWGNGLQAACQSGQLAIVQLLLDHGADVNTHYGNHGTALCAASGNGHAAIFRTLLNCGARIDTPGGKYDNNALHEASKHGHNEVVRILAESGADLNVPCGGHGSALQTAVVVSSGSDPAPIQTLIDHGGNVNLQGGNYGNVLQAACVETCGNDSCILPNNARYGFPVYMATDICRAKIVRLLLDNGAQINAQGGHYGNALQAACAHSCKRVVRLLLDKGADPIAKGGVHGSVKSAVEAKDRIDIAGMVIDATIRRLDILKRYRAAVPVASSATAIVLEEAGMDCESESETNAQQTRHSSVIVDLTVTQKDLPEPTCGAST